MSWTLLRSVELYSEGDGNREGDFCFHCHGVDLIDYGAREAAAGTVVVAEHFVRSQRLGCMYAAGKIGFIKLDISSGPHTI